MTERCRILIVYYSRTGTTRRVAELLASELDADIEPIRERAGPRSRDRARGYVRSVIDALCHRRAAVMPALLDVAAYDLVVVGAPVWAGGACAPVRAWLESNGGQIRHLALFCCEGARGSGSALKQMSEAAGKTSLAACADQRQRSVPPQGRQQTRSVRAEDQAKNGGAAGDGVAGVARAVARAVGKDATKPAANHATRRSRCVDDGAPALRPVP
ncbi:flavodoxin family protein [Paraburkholderia sp. 32]|uniref:flavodoxin family protein n=1 Tax=Paraburkholderia sp. 32 TaxID=2991057 RepID=UPI003D1E0295